MAKRDSNSKPSKGKVYPKGVDEQVLDDAVMLLDKAVQTASNTERLRTKVTAPLLRGDAMTFIRNAPPKEK